jgi:NTP pyrophosphatase (non-canonical NTP hydrolase)
MMTEEKDPVVLRIILSPEQVDAQFVCLFERMSEEINQNARNHGFWEDEENVNKDASTGLRLALVHSEISEALEAVRKGNPPDDKVSEFSSVEAELADAVIRIMDYSKHNKLRLGQAILAKHKFNVGRPYRHGKKF